MIKMMSDMVLSLSTPKGISYMWNLGSMLGMLMMTQIVSGWLLTLFYSNFSTESFSSVWILHLESWNGSVLHWIHLNGASFIFLILYLHLLKGIHFQSWKTNKYVWLSGFILMLLVMGAAFLGYVLPFGQMSLWGATVITNLISVVSTKLVIWIWGGYSVNAMTVNLFFTLHYLLPFVVLVIMGIHLWLLHYNGSSHGSTKTYFWPLFIYKDMLNLSIFMFLLWWTFQLTYLTSDPENFIPANPSSSPLHIKPEWYFLQYYAILRSIPNKTFGVMMFLFSLIVLPMLVINKSLNQDVYYPSWGFESSLFVILNILLLWIGGSPVEYPFYELGQILTVFYFSWFLIKFIY